MRKRVNSEYKDSKFDSAFTLAAMSADEDEADPEPGEAKRYVSRAPDYRSELVSDCQHFECQLTDIPESRSKTFMTQLIAWWIRSLIKPNR